jgi:GT2 family glycosyltransferase
VGIDTGEGEPLVSIVIPVLDKWEYTERCLASLARETTGAPCEIVVVDNASTDATRSELPRRADIRLLRNETNLGFARGCNQGAAAARGRYVLFLNNDTEALPGWLPPLLRAVEEPGVGAAGAKLLFPDGTLQHAGIAIAYARPFPISDFHLLYRRPASESTTSLRVSAVTGACLLMPLALFRELGGFDEGYLNSNEDVDLCLRVRERGLAIAYVAESVLVHHESVSEGRYDRVKDNVNRMHRRWMGRLTAFDLDRRRTDRPVPPAPGRPPLSVVIPTLEALKELAPCLEDLAQNLGCGDELVVSDAGSKDCTVLFAEHFATEGRAPVRILRLPGDRGGGLAGMKRALQAGLAEGRPLAAVVSPAARPAPGWLDLAFARLPVGGASILPWPGSGPCLLAPRVLLARIAERVPEVLLLHDPAPLLAVLRGAGVPAELLDASPSAAAPLAR